MSIVKIYRILDITVRTTSYSYSTDGSVIEMASGSISLSDQLMRVSQNISFTNIGGDSVITTASGNFLIGMSTYYNGYWSSALTVIVCKIS